MFCMGCIYNEIKGRVDSMSNKNGVVDLSNRILDPAWEAAVITF